MIKKSFSLILLFSLLLFSNFTQAMNVNLDDIYQDVAEEIANRLYQKALHEIPNINNNTWANMANNNDLGHVDKVKDAINNISNDIVVKTLRDNPELIKKAIPYIFRKEIRRAVDNILNNQNYDDNENQRGRDYQFSDIQGSFIHEIRVENNADLEKIVDKIALYFVNTKKNYNFIDIAENIQPENQNLYQQRFQEYQYNNLYVQEGVNNVLVDDLINELAKVVADNTKTFLMDKMIDFNNFIYDTDNNKSKTKDLKIGVTSLIHWNSNKGEINKALLPSIYGKYDFNVSKQLQLRSKASVIAGSFFAKHNNFTNISKFIGGFYAECELAHIKKNLSLKVSYKDFQGKGEFCSQATIPLFSSIDITLEARKEFLKDPYHKDKEAESTLGIYLNTYEGLYKLSNYLGFSANSISIGSNFSFSFKDNRFSLFSNLRYTPVKNSINNFIKDFEPNSVDLGAMFQFCIAKNYYLNGYFIAKQHKRDDIDVICALNLSVQI